MIGRLQANWCRSSAAIARGLAAEGFDAASAGDRSKDFGVTVSKSDLGSGADSGTRPPEA
jgi:hypothetical protein